MRYTLLLSMFLSALASQACSCFGPQTFCATLDPPYPNPEWWVPDVVVMGVRLGQEAHGMDVKVVHVYAGGTEVSPDQTIRVWGDCGFACRVYPDSWNEGDTVIWGFQYTDLAGNSLCQGDLEQPGEFMISICGIYWLQYLEGIVSGPITAEEEQSMPIEQFEDLVATCLNTGITERTVANDLIIASQPGCLELRMNSPERVRLSVHDATGRMVVSRSWDGGSLVVNGLGAGAYMVRVEGSRVRNAKKALVE